MIAQKFTISRLSNYEGKVGSVEIGDERDFSFAAVHVTNFSSAGSAYAGRTSSQK